MNRLSRVLVAVDFSRSARDAFEYALTISARHGAELVAVHAIPPNQSFRWQAHARTTLLEQLRRRAAEAHVRLLIRVQSGDATATILLQARSLQAGVIVIGTRRRWIPWLRLMSVGERVAAKADVPVLLVPASRRVRTKWPLGHSIQAPAIAVPGGHRTVPEPDVLFRNILVPIDFSDVSIRALTAALQIAQHSGGRLRLLHVLEGFPSESIYSGSRAFHLPHEWRTRVTRINRTLHSLIPADALNWSDIDVVTVSGRAHEAIATAASEQNADLIVIGLPRRPRVEEFLAGSTAHGVLHRATAPVLLVPGPSTPPLDNPADEGDARSTPYGRTRSHAF
jgi:nucleotide-binding universal stress UspA family protein